MSDQPEDLFCKLEIIMDRIRQVVQENKDADTFMVLAEEHAQTLNEFLHRSKDDKRCIQGQTNTFKSQLSELMREIQRYQNDIALSIKQLADGKKLVKAYRM